MKKNDQWFSPGDKVVQVYETEGWDDSPESSWEPTFGEVYCVAQFMEAPDGEPNLVSLVGDDGITETSDGIYGWAAADFRRVEEIRLCVRAAEKMREEITQPL